MEHSFYALAAALVVPLFLAEHGIARLRGQSGYRLRTTLGHLGCFAGEIFLAWFLYLDVFLLYDTLGSRVALFALPASSWVTWVAAFVALDFAYYVGHRACHRVAFLWALHEVHHQPHEYNLAVGVRGPWFTALSIAPFMVPLALVGFPASVMFPVYVAHTVWKLAVHTRLVGKLGWLELALVTPSIHRVHHGSNARFVDRNFGGALNVWDRIFGTLQQEDEEPVFGSGEDFTADPIRSNVEPWRALSRRVHAARGIGGALRVLLGPPESHPHETPRDANLSPVRGSAAT